MEEQEILNTITLNAVLSGSTCYTKQNGIQREGAAFEVYHQQESGSISSERGQKMLGNFLERALIQEEGYALHVACDTGFYTLSIVKLVPTIQEAMSTCAGMGGGTVYEFSTGMHVEVTRIPEYVEVSHEPVH